LNELKSKIIEK